MSDLTGQLKGLAADPGVYPQNYLGDMLAVAADALDAAIAKAEQAQPVAWKPISEPYKLTDELDIMLSDGSILCAVLPQFDGDLWWGGDGTGEKFIDPKTANVTHWRIHDAPPATPDRLTDRELQSLRNLGNEAERAADEIAALRSEINICRDAIEVAFDLVSEWKPDDDGDSAVRRTTLRRLNEAIGKAAPRLLMERPEGQKIYGLHFRELRAEVEELRKDAERYRYLRNRLPDEVFALHGPIAGAWIDCENSVGNLTMLTGVDADQEIDAAMAQEK